MFTIPHNYIIKIIKTFASTFVICDDTKAIKINCPQKHITHYKIVIKSWAYIEEPQPSLSNLAYSQPCFQSWLLVASFETRSRLIHQNR